MDSIKYKSVALVVFCFVLVTAWIPGVVYAHCDTMGGPVIEAARKALETGNVDSVLIWVQKDDEAEIKKAFQKTLSVRKLNPEAKELADMYFFETLVRVHRAGEGAPYVGLKSEVEMDPALEEADKAIETGSVEALAKEIGKRAGERVTMLFREVLEKRKHKDESVAAGREFVEAYVTFVHYVEELYGIIHREAGQGKTEQNSHSH